MHVAASSGHHVIVQHFLLRGMTVDLQDDFGCSPLHHAAQHGKNLYWSFVLAFADQRNEPQPAKFC